jgi:hypothetical protein
MYFEVGNLIICWRSNFQTLIKFIFCLNIVGASVMEMKPNQILLGCNPLL